MFPNKYGRLQQIPVFNIKRRYIIRMGSNVFTGVGGQNQKLSYFIFLLKKIRSTFEMSVLVVHKIYEIYNVI